MEQFLKELIDLVTVESNNGDYYTDGYVDADKIATLINKHYPDLEAKFYNTYCRWQPRQPVNEHTGHLQKYLSAIYGTAIQEQLQREATIIGFMRKEGE